MITNYMDAVKRDPSSPLKPFAIFAEGFFIYCMFYVYIIQSKFDKSYYKGFSIQPLNRLLQHNNKESQYTAAKIPWELAYIEILENKTLSRFINNCQAKKTN